MRCAMLFSLENPNNYVILLPVIASVVVCCRKLRGIDDDARGIMLTKDAGSAEGVSKSRPSANKRPPPNTPIAPPPKDPLDDTLRGVKSLKMETSGKGGKPKKREKHV
ncbi:hypothetical protein V3C99_008509 [Haemonchus contortus]|uniref:Secreted protein n=1 Tax=Haemonchus contortus TaxID=6289 RepID=A0A7I4YMT7_HAECO